MENGKKAWYIADGWIPVKAKSDEVKYEGHEALIILNCNECDVKVFMDVYFEDKAPIKDIVLDVPATYVLKNPSDFASPFLRLKLNHRLPH